MLAEHHTDGGPYAWATSEDAATVTAIDLTTRRAVATLPTGLVPHSMALTPKGDRLYVVNRRGLSLTVVDPRTRSVLGTVELSSDPMAGAVSPDGRWLAILGRVRSVAWVLDAATGALRHEVPLVPSGEGEGPVGRASADEPTTTGGAPASTHPIWTADSRGFYAEDNRRSSLVRVDALNGSVASRVALPSIAHVVYLEAAGARAYALCIGAVERGVPPSVVQLDADGDRVLANVPILLPADESGELHHATFDATGRYLWVTNMGQGQPRGGRSVHVLDGDTLELVARLEARPGAGHPLVSHDGRRVFVVNHSAPVISVFDAERLTPVADVALPGARAMGHGCFFTDDGRHFWAVSSTAGAAYAVDTASLQVVARVPTGPNSQDLIGDWCDAYA